MFQSPPAGFATFLKSHGGGASRVMGPLQKKLSSQFMSLYHPEGRGSKLIAESEQILFGKYDLKDNLDLSHVRTL